MFELTHRTVRLLALLLLGLIGPAIARPTSAQEGAPAAPLFERAELELAALRARIEGLEARLELVELALAAEDPAPTPEPGPAPDPPPPSPDPTPEPTPDPGPDLSGFWPEGQPLDYRPAPPALPDTALVVELSGGAQVLAPGTRYALAGDCGPLTIAPGTSKVELDGRGYSCAGINFPSSDATSPARKCSDVYVHDLTVRTDEQYGLRVWGERLAFERVHVIAPPGGQGAGFYSWGAADVLVRACTFDCLGDQIGVRLVNCHRVAVIDSKARVAQRHGFRIHGDASSSFVTAWRVETWGPWMVGYASAQQGAQEHLRQVWVEDCTVHATRPDGVPRDGSCITTAPPLWPTATGPVPALEYFTLKGCRFYGAPIAPRLAEGQLAGIVAAAASAPTWLVSDNLAQGFEPAAPAPVPTPDPAPAPPAPAPAPDDDGADVPSVSLELRLRDGTTVETTFPPDGEWERRGSRRWLEQREVLGPVLAVVHVEQWEGFDGARVTASLANGFEREGAVEFSRYAWSGGGDGDSIRGRHAIQVRGILARRWFVGPDAARLAAWEQVLPATGYPEWVGPWAELGLEQERSRQLAIGPYTCADAQGPLAVWGNGSLNGSHGGWLIAPWNFGAEGWQRGARAGFRWAEARAFGVLDRSPLALFDRRTLRPLNPHQPYWLGRTVEHEPIGWQVDVGDGWCPYLPQLAGLRAHDYTHGQREAGAFATLAEEDAWAEWALAEVLWHDYACHLDGGDNPSNPLLWPAAKIIERTPAHQGSHLAGRGLAHVVRRFLWAEPYLAARGLDRRESDGRPWREVLTELVAHVARPNGIAHAAAAEWGVPAPTARAREVDLLGTSYRALGLVELDRAWRRTMRPHPELGSAGETIESDRAWWPQGKFASAGVTGAANYFRPYDALRSNFEFLGNFTLEQALAKPDVLGFSGPGETLLDLVDPALYLPAGGEAVTR